MSVEFCYDIYKTKSTQNEYLIVIKLDSYIQFLSLIDTELILYVASKHDFLVCGSHSNKFIIIESDGSTTLVIPEYPTTTLISDLERIKSEHMFKWFTYDVCSIKEYMKLLKTYNDHVLQVSSCVL